MKAFQTKADLLIAYATAHSEPDTIVASMKAVYLPHVYRGGWMIPGFGYSTERIGVCVSAEKAGVPA